MLTSADLRNCNNDHSKRLSSRILHPNICDTVVIRGSEYGTRSDPHKLQTQGKRESGPKDDAQTQSRESVLTARPYYIRVVE